MINVPQNPTSREDFPTMNELVNEFNGMRDSSVSVPVARIWFMNEGHDSKPAYCGTVDGIPNALANERALSFCLSPDGVQVILFGTADPFKGK